jgi:MFS family permease
VSSYLDALRHHSFRYLFAGQAASVIGDQVVIVALALFITQRTGSATDLGLVLGAQASTLVTLLLFGGVWADRLPRQRIMIVTDSVRAVMHGLLAGLIFTGAVRVWEIAAIEAVFGAAQAFFQPAYTGLLPQTVPEPLIQDARALTESVSNLAFMLGPALATALVLGVGAGEAFAFDAATFVFSAVLLTRVRPRVRGKVVAEEAEPVLRALRSGFGEVRSRPWVWVTIAAFTGAVFCVYAPWYALAPLIARSAYGGAGVFGLLEAVAGVGAVCGGLAGVVWRPARPVRAGLIFVLAWPVQCGAFALGAPVEAMVVCAFATGIGWSLMMIWWETALARHIPPHALSRVSAWDWMGALALLPVGYLVVGPLSAAVGLRVVLGVGSVLGLVILGGALLPRATRELNGGEAAGSAQDLARDVRVEAGSEAEVANVDPLVGAVHERP